MGQSFTSEVIAKVQNSTTSDLYMLEADNVLGQGSNPTQLIEKLLDKEIVKPDFLPILYPTSKYAYTTGIPNPGIICNL